MNDLALYIETGKKLIDEFIKSHFIKKHYDKKFSHNKFSLTDAMLYTLSMPGKRIRPIILLLTGESLGFSDKKKLLPFATSIELIHSYSLIHDDLPSMDNDDLRRGKPTSHIVFGEATAILAGDALLAEAFAVLSDKDYIEGFDAVKIIEAVRELSCAAGVGGLAEGQFHDVNSFGEPLDFEKIEYINEKKTGSLIASACAIGAILSGKDETAVSEFRKFGGYIGLAFQAVDDVLGITGNKEILGKTAGIDRINNKPTMVENIGLERTRKLIEEYNKKAMAHLEKTGAETGMFIELIKYLTNRLN